MSDFENPCSGGIEKQVMKSIFIYSVPGLLLDEKVAGDEYSSLLSSDIKLPLKHGLPHFLKC